MYAKRFWIALILGIIAGVICAWTGYKQTPEDVRTMTVLSAILNRAMIGFIIGLSCWRIGWLLHGVLIGFLGTLPMSFPLIFVDSAGFNAFLIYTIAGIVWGFLIELLTTKVFKAPMTIESGE